MPKNIQEPLIILGSSALSCRGETMQRGEPIKCTRVGGEGSGAVHSAMWPLPPPMRIEFAYHKSKLNTCACAAYARYQTKTASRRTGLQRTNQEERAQTHGKAPEWGGRGRMVMHSHGPLPPHPCALNLLIDKEMTMGGGEGSEAVH